jgi:hypothetical protein
MTSFLPKNHLGSGGSGAFGTFRTQFCKRTLYIVQYTDFIAYSAGCVRKIYAETVASINLIYSIYIEYLYSTLVLVRVGKSVRRVTMMDYHFC